MNLLFNILQIGQNFKINEYYLINFYEIKI